MKNVTIERDSLSDMIEELLNMGDEVEKVTMQAANAYGEAGVKAMQAKYISSVNGAKSGDFIYESISYRMIPAPNADTVVWGGVGVYEMKDVMARFGKTEKDLTAAQLAYWLEHGTTRLASGARKPGKIAWEDVTLPTVSTTPTPFISKSSFEDDNIRDSAFADKFNQLMDDK